MFFCCCFSCSQAILQPGKAGGVFKRSELILQKSEFMRICLSKRHRVSVGTPASTEFPNAKHQHRHGHGAAIRSFLSNRQIVKCQSNSEQAHVKSDLDVGRQLR